MQERIRHEHQTPMFPNGFGVAHAILIQAQMRFTVLIKGFGLPDASGKIDLVPPQGSALHWGCPEEPQQKGARSRYPPPLQ